jgi:hypothetical protein
MAEYTVTVPDGERTPEQVQVALDTFAHAMSMGEALVTPIPSGFPQQCMPEVALRIATMLRQYVAVYVPNAVVEGEPVGESV